jgi:hypothetical protein
MMLDPAVVPVQAGTHIAEAVIMGGFRENKVCLYGHSNR